MHRIAEGVEVTTSRYWHTNSGLVRTQVGVVLIDAGVLPNEMAAIASACQGTQILAGISTHAHWDHVLWSAVLGTDVPRIASPDAAKAAIADRAVLLRRLDREEEEWGVQWDRALFGRTVAHDVGTLDGHGAPLLRLIDLPGHAPGQVGVWVSGPDVLFAGDTVSDIDPPALGGDGGAAMTYLDTLRRLVDLVGDAQVVVPGHGTPCDAPEAKRRLARDRRYLEVLLRSVEGADASTADVHSVIARVAGTLDDPRLSAPGGRQLHLENVQDLVRRDR